MRVVPPRKLLQAVVLKVLLLPLAASSSFGCGRPSRSETTSTCIGATCAPARTPRELMYRFLGDGDIASANQMLNDIWPVPRYQPVQLPPPAQLTWNEDPYADKYWEFEFYGMRPTANLLWAYLNTGDRRYRDKLIDVIASFSARGQTSPFSLDKHTSAFRAMVLVNTFFKLQKANALTSSEQQMLRDLVHTSSLFLADPRHFDADFNHGINEANALLLIAENFPDMPEAASWGATARARLDLLMTTSVGSDGVANELSPYYHFYIVDALWQAEAWASDNGISIPPRLAPTVASMIRYGTYIMQPDGNLPMVAACLQRNVPQYDPAVFDAVRAQDSDFDFVMSAGQSGTEPADRLALFPSAGHAILRSGFGPQKRFKEQTHVFFDFGPYRTDQSQFDALNVIVYSAGRTLITDSGLYTYVEGPDRSYFIGTRAHNTVVVDGLDQNQGSAVAGLSRSTPTWLYQSGSHTLYAGVTHRRAVVLLAQDAVLVVDRLASATPHTYEQTWHFQPDETVAITGTDVLGSDVNGPNVALHQALPAGLAVSTVKGATAPLVDGWYSEQYQVKFPSASVKFAALGANADFVTLLASGANALGPASVFATPTATGMNAIVCVQGTGWNVAITDLAQPGEDVQVTTTSGGCGP